MDKPGLERRVAHGLLVQARESHVGWIDASDKWLEGTGKRSTVGGDRDFHRRLVDQYDFIIATLVDGDYD